jgi:hypothetical protein
MFRFVIAVILVILLGIVYKIENLNIHMIQLFDAVEIAKGKVLFWPKR